MLAILQPRLPEEALEAAQVCVSFARRDGHAIDEQLTLRVLMAHIEAPVLHARAKWHLHGAPR